MRAAKITVAKSLIARLPAPFRGAGFFVASGLKEWGQAPRPEGLPEKKAAPPCAGLHRPVKESVATLAAAANLPGNRRLMIEHLAIVASCHHRASREGERCGLPPDVAKTKDRGLTSRQGIAYTNDNTMARLHSETTSTLAATARGMDGFVTGQSDRRGSTLVVEHSYSEDKAPGGRKGDWSHAQHLPLRGELLTQYTAGAGSPGERKGTADLCKGIMNASGAFVITRGVRAPGFSIFGYSFNPALEFNDTEECKTKDVHVPELAVLRPCA